MPFDIDDAQPVLEEFYGDFGLMNTVYEDNPAFGMVQKKKVSGKHYDWPVKYKNTQNRSRTGSTALNKANTWAALDFNAPTPADYNADSITLDALSAAEDDETRFVEVLSETVDSVLAALGNNAGTDVFSDRGASRGQAGVVSTTSLTLSNIEDVVRFEVGDELVSSEANGLSGTLQAGSATITAIDRDTGILTTDVDWTTQIPLLDTDDYLFCAGDWGIGRAGLPDWCPASTSGLATSFYNVNRSLDATRLAGSRIDGSGLPLLNALRKGMTRLAREGCKPDAAFCSFDNYNSIVTELDNKVQYQKTGANDEDANVGFDGITISGAKGKITLYPDRSCRTTEMYILKMASFCCIHRQAKPVKIDNKDGNLVSREPSEFGYDVRGASFANFIMKNPRDICVVHTLPAAS
jgi:hypothetical protein